MSQGEVSQAPVGDVDPRELELDFLKGLLRAQEKELEKAEQEINDLEKEIRELQTPRTGREAALREHRVPQLEEKLRTKTFQRDFVLPGLIEQTKARIREIELDLQRKPPKPRTGIG